MSFSIKIFVLKKLEVTDNSPKNNLFRKNVGEHSAYLYFYKYHSFVSSSYILGNDKCEKLSEIPICLRMLSFIQVSITVVIGHCIFMGVFHCCIQWTANGNQKFLQQIFIECLLWTEHRGRWFCVGKEVGQCSSL